MYSIDQYKGDIQKYETLKAKLGTIVASLDSSAAYINKAANDIASSYKVDGEGAHASERALNLKSKVSATSDYLSSTVIPQIDNSISDAQSNISYLEEQERLRREQEEERRRREQESQK